MNKLTRTKHFVGEKYFKLTLIEKVGCTKWNKPIWRMMCECGTETIGVLRDKKSCGCVRRENILKLNISKRLNCGEANFNRLYKHYERSSDFRKLEFDLTKEQFREIVNKNCHYCGRPPSSDGMFNKLSFGTFKYNGIDRVDNSHGYILTNCVPCCSMCNFGKRKLTQQQFYDWVCKVSRHMKKLGFTESNIDNISELLKFGTPIDVL